jgi:secondary thiamine-phosphate synthase enzyme
MTPLKSTLSRPRVAAVDAVVSATLSVDTRGPGFLDLTAEVARFLADSAAGDGALTTFVRHTSASLTVQENADPTVQADLLAVLDRLAPQNAPWRHDTEGPDDMPAHVKTMLTATSLQIPVIAGRLALGS